MDNTQKIWYQDYNLEPLDAEFSAEQHIQNPLNSFPGKVVTTALILKFII